MKTIQSTRIAAIFLFVGTVVLASGDVRGEEHVLICIPGGPGNAEDAAPRIERFLQGLAGTSGESFVGHYENSREGCDKIVRNTPPRFAIFDHAVFASLQKKLGLTPFLEVEPSNGLPIRYHLMSRGGETLESLKGKALLSAHWDKADFLSRVAFKIDLKTNFKGGKSSALRAIKKLVKGKVDVILLDESEYQSLRELPFAKDLIAVSSSDVLPGLALSEVGPLSALGKKVQKAGAALCTKDPDACIGVEMKSLRAVDSSRYLGLLP